jgi:hypothetical protein
VADDFSTYVTLRTEGHSAEQVFARAERDGLDLITRIRMIRAVYGLSPGGAKEVMLRADGVANSLNEHQQRIADQLAPPQAS